ncbi:MAG: hypothetical protein Q9191_000160 [Dirinaria sp. TL-2023a]
MDDRHFFPPRESHPSSEFEVPSLNAFVFLWIFAVFFILFVIYRLLVSYYRRKRDREWEQRLRFLADHVAHRLAPLQTKSQVPTHRVPELAGWRGLRYGTGLGFGIGLALWVGIAKRSGVETTLLVLTVWWMMWNWRVRRQEQEILVQEEETRWTVVSCLVWVLSWATWGAGATWTWQARRISLECIQVGGFKWDYVSGSVGLATRSLGLLAQVIAFVVAGTVWALARLFGSLLFAYGPGEQENGFESREPPNADQNSRRNSNPSPSPDPTNPAPPQEDPSAQLIGALSDDSLPSVPLQQGEQQSRRRTRGRP